MHVWYVDKKCSRIREIVRHKVCMILPILLLFEQNLPPFRAESAGPYFRAYYSTQYRTHYRTHGISSLQVVPKLVPISHCCFFFPL